MNWLANWRDAPRFKGFGRRQRQANDYPVRRDIASLLATHGVDVSGPVPKEPRDPAVIDAVIADLHRYNIRKRAKKQGLVIVK